MQDVTWLHSFARQVTNHFLDLNTLQTVGRDTLRAIEALVVHLLQSGRLKICEGLQL